MIIFLFLMCLSIIKTERSFTSVKAVLVFRQKFFEHEKTSFLSLRDIFIIGYTQRNFSKNILMNI